MLTLLGYIVGAVLAMAIIFLTDFDRGNDVGGRILLIAGLILLVGMVGRIADNGR